MLETNFPSKFDHFCPAKCLIMLLNTAKYMYFFANIRDMKEHRVRKNWNDFWQDSSKCTILPEISSVSSFITWKFSIFKEIRYYLDAEAYKVRWILMPCVTWNTVDRKCPERLDIFSTSRPEPFNSPIFPRMYRNFFFDSTAKKVHCERKDSLSPKIRRA